MKEEIKVPSMGESISEATVSTIIKAAGSQVKMDDELLELATDKVNQVLYAPQSGIFNPTVKEEDVVKIGQVIGYIEVGAKSSASEKKSETTKEEIKEEIKEQPQPKAEARAEIPAIPQEVTSERARVSVDNYIDEMKACSQKVRQPAVSTGPKVSLQERESRVKMSKIRKIIATRLVEVQSTAAMLTTFNEVDLTKVIALREKYKETFSKKYGAKLGFMSFFVKATVSALQAFRAVNSYIDGEELVQRHYYDIGIAVGTERGLIVPVVRDCDQLSFGQIEMTIASFAQKAKEGKLNADDLQGGCFTITNGGVYGSLLSTPILNPRQCAILGMHKIMKRPIVVEDQMVIGQMMYLALSYDHRIIDGKEAVSFLVHLKNCLEDPSRLLLEI